MKKRFQLIALLAVALLGACSGGKDKVAVEQVDEKPRVKLADVKARPVEQIHEYTATVEAEVKNNIAPSSPVRIDRILVEVGDRVSKGQKLVSMDEANLKQTKFQLDNQEIEFKRMDELYKVGGASKSEWDAAKMALDIKETSVAAYCCWDGVSTSASQLDRRWLFEIFSTSPSGYLANHAYRKADESAP